MAQAFRDVLCDTLDARVTKTGNYGNGEIDFSSWGGNTVPIDPTWFKRGGISFFIGRNAEDASLTFTAPENIADWVAADFFAGEVRSIVCIKQAGTSGVGIEEANTPNFILLGASASSDFNQASPSRPLYCHCVVPAKNTGEGYVGQYRFYM